MFKRKLRIPRGIKFNNSKLISTYLFTMKIKENGLFSNRFAIVVGKKISKKAVVRNRIKRLISSCIEELRSNLEQGYDMIIIAKNYARETDRTQFREEISLSFKKAGFMKESPS